MAHQALWWELQLWRNPVCLENAQLNHAAPACMLPLCLKWAASWLTLKPVRPCHLAG